MEINMRVQVCQCTIARFALFACLPFGFGVMDELTFCQM